MRRLSSGGVLDTSVAVKLVRLDEPLVDPALAVLDRVCRSRSRTWASPDVFDIECASAMSKAVLRAGLPPDEALEGLALLQGLPHRRVPTDVLVKSALVLALALSVSVYDACYVVLADILGVPLVTADSRLVRALEGSGHDVLHLSDLDFAKA